MTNQEAREAQIKHLAARVLAYAHANEQAMAKDRRKYRRWLNVIMKLTHVTVKTHGLRQTNPAAHRRTMRRLHDQKSK